MDGKRKYFLSFLYILLIALVFVHRNRYFSESNYNRCFDYFLNQNYQTSLKCYQSFLDKKDINHKSTLQAIVYMINLDCKSAKSELEYVVENSKDDPLLYENAQKMLDETRSCLVEETEYKTKDFSDNKTVTEIKTDSEQPMSEIPAQVEGISKKDLEGCFYFYKKNKHEKAAACFLELIQKDDRLFLHYYYAYELMRTFRYDEAKKELYYILENEKENLKLIDATKKLLGHVNEMSYKIENENVNDTGDYYRAIETQSVKWENPDKIRVYIYANDIKYHVIKKAFETWDSQTGPLIGFNYVHSPNNADISIRTVSHNELKRIYDTAKTEDKVPGHKDYLLGLTLPQIIYYINNDAKKYMNKATVYVTKDYNQADLKDEEYYSVALHEIGHALGIAGHSNRDGDIMYKYSSDFCNYKKSLSNRDINTLKKIYRYN